MCLLCFFIFEALRCIRTANRESRKIDRNPRCKEQKGFSMPSDSSVPKFLRHRGKEKCHVNETNGTKRGEKKTRAFVSRC